MKRFRPWHLGESGTTAIEYAIILPVLLLLTFGVMESGRLLFAFISLSRATEAAARCGAVKCPHTGTISDYAVTQAWGLKAVTSANFPLSPVPSTCPSGNFWVEGTYVFTFAVPHLLPFGATKTLTATACYPSHN